MFLRAKNLIARKVKKATRSKKAKAMGLLFVEPNFLYFPPKNKCVVIDVGCSYEADFSCLMIDRHNATSYAIDPTKKHQKELLKLVDNYNGKLFYLPYAVGSINGELTFYESKENESGSLMQQHVNVQQDTIKSYNCKVVTLSALLSEINIIDVEILKLDIEGAEYELLSNITQIELQPFRQLFIEFHHHALPQYTEKDTRNIVAKIKTFGFNSFSIDDHNFLFYR
jgi:FkbM family methyltransferase